MQFDHYQKLYAAFNEEHFPTASLEEIEDKMLEEMDELAFEIADGGTLENKINECIDNFNMSVKLLTAYGVKDICHAAAEKLRITSEKYRAQGVGK